jgi:hypothetical protein
VNEFLDGFGGDHGSQCTNASVTDVQRCAPRERRGGTGTVMP